MDYPFIKIAEIVHGEIISGQKGYISSISTDSRRIYSPDNYLFIALKGPSHNGHDYIKELISKGVKYFLVDDSFDIEFEDDNIGFITVSDTLIAFQELAKHHRLSFTGQVVAITGSNGKTVVKEWLAQTISKISSVSKNPKSYNSQIGVPISILQMDKGPEYHILEAGISMPGEMGKLEEMIKPDIGILTNIGDAHQENFDDQKSKLTEKIKLFKESRLIFYCKDSQIIHESIKQAYGSNKELVTWALNEEADLNVRIEALPGGKTKLIGKYHGSSFDLNTSFSDSASIENIIHICLFWLYHGWPISTLQKIVLELEPVAMRLEQKEGLRSCTLINDFYNADLNSLSIALDLLINQLPQKKKSLILSDLLQTGFREDQLIEKINLLLEGKNLFRIILIGPVFFANLSKFKIPVTVYPDTASFLSDFPLIDLKDEAILLKGARIFTFEKISSRLEKRLHNTIVEVNMNKLLENLNHFRAKLNPGTKIMAMVKAFSYGSGSHEIAKFLAHQRIDYLGVAFADEGINLRRSGISIPIMVMNPDLNIIENLFEYKLEPEIFSIKALNTFLQKAEQTGLKDYPIHIKLDTGMHRLGFQPKQISELVEIINNQNFLRIKSVFSHLSTADLLEESTYVHEQAETFLNAVIKLRANYKSPFFTHLTNTAGIQRFPEYHFDMVRLGIGLYGIDPSKTEKLSPVISMKSHITQIHTLQKGESIGYGNSEYLAEDGTIAVIPVGYADGLDRRLGKGNFKVQIKGYFAPIIGQICMDMCMIYITNIPAEVGDEVVLIGESLPLEDLAKKLETIPYEILTSIPQRVKRVYLFE